MHGKEATSKALGMYSAQDGLGTCLCLPRNMKHADLCVLENVFVVNYCKCCVENEHIRGICEQNVQRKLIFPVFIL